MGMGLHCERSPRTLLHSHTFYTCCLTREGLLWSLSDFLIHGILQWSASTSGRRLLAPVPSFIALNSDKGFMPISEDVSLQVPNTHYLCTTLHYPHYTYASVSRSFLFFTCLSITSSLSRIETHYEAILISFFTRLHTSLPVVPSCSSFAYR
ncbi:uncharacterized protein LY89DRAFT_63403 [Mollisia scopiformis]|uniref:Uncharacterized protein n=1 Tax=Mollisia scopiformis TaxID=149040 RepID=A0A194X980_MOLSC|nr:uncharacterized protein LY89DRAFT_63403 [Mollisia scopiformis]KUJ16725.1 hypothetical protein LY89DRAFT_63403 [Mollisia scopiformis]